MTDGSFEEFVTAGLPALGRYARALTGDAHAAEDLVQDTLVKVASAWHRIRTDQNPQGYATTVMFRTYVSWWRARRRRPEPVLLIDDPPANVDSYAALEARLVLREALAGLSTLQRAVLVATYLDDASDDTIAELVGRSPATVRSLRRRGLLALRGVLGTRAEMDMGKDTKERIRHG